MSEHSLANNTVYIRTTADELWRALTDGDQSVQYVGARVQSTWRSGDEIVYLSPDGTTTRLVEGTLQILFLYDALRERFPSSVVDVNRAIAVAMVSGAPAGLDELDSIPERELIDNYPYALAAYAELHTSLGQLDLARAYLGRALAHQPSQAQRLLLERKLAAIGR